MPAYDASRFDPPAPLALVTVKVRSFTATIIPEPNPSLRLPVHYT
jgi:hypothetical protein